MTLTTSHEVSREGEGVGEEEGSGAGKREGRRGEGTAFLQHSRTFLSTRQS